MQGIFQIKNLEFLDIIQYPDMEIPYCKMIFITGESGCGKSTLLKLINATVSPNAGSIFYKQTDIQEMDTLKLRKEVLLVSQQVWLFDGTIKDNFRIYYEYREQECPKDSEIEKYLEICCGEFSLDSKCEKLSGGERQRVFLAICISFCPEVLLFDEPTASLDEVTAIKFFHSIKEFCETHKITPIIICHNPRLVEQFSEYTINLEKRIRV